MFQAKVLCLIAGIEPVDPMDGSANWWMFQAEAGKIVDDIRRRFPLVPHQTNSASNEPARKEDQDQGEDHIPPC